ncbi:MAG: 5-oxoprolinase subunit PxpA [Ilumatobacteraceae bacterium]
MIAVDLNSDLGEGFGQWSMGDDSALLDIVSSANIACGFHAGDPSIMGAVCRAAAERNVAIGAHVSYRDFAGFGRRFIDIDSDELRDDVTYQIGALDAFARSAGTHVAYVKPHGALYNAIVHHERQAAAVIAGVTAFGPLAMMGLPGAAVLALADAAGLAVIHEAFVDRAYRSDGTLVARTQAGAVLHDVDAISARAVRMAVHGTVTAIDGTDIEIAAQSLCVHGDTPGAVRIARAVRAALEAAGVTIAPVV